MKTPITLLLPVCLLAGCTAQTGYVIEHSSPQYTDGKYMYVLDGVTWQPLDSARIENSAFRIASHNKGSGMGLLYMGASSNPADLAQVGYLMFLEDGTIHTLPDSTYEFVYRGTPMNDAHTAFQQFRKTATADQQRNKLRKLVSQNHNVLGCYLLHDLLDLASKTEVEQLMDTCRRYVQTTGRRISYEYAMIDGVNDSDAQADQLARLLKGTLGHVNLIPLNDVEESPLKPSRRVAAFQKRLERQGVTVTVRRKLGSDIDASCGQLRRKAMQSVQGMGGQTTNRKEDEVP